MEQIGRKLKAVLMPANFPPPEKEGLYFKIYSCWKEVWLHAFKDELQVLKKDEALSSDNFTRQSEILALFFQEKCVGLTTQRVHKLSTMTTQDDSYFLSLPQIKNQNTLPFDSDILVTSNFTINFEFRKNAFGIDWKEVMLATLVNRFKCTPFNYMIATTRVNKKVPEMTYKSGAQPVLQGLPYSIKGVEIKQGVDVVTWDKNNLSTRLSPQHLSLAEFAWNNLEDYLDNLTNKDKKITSKQLLRSRKNAA